MKDADLENLPEGHATKVLLLFSLGLGLVVVCGCLLVFFGILFGYPYFITREFENEAVVCTVEDRWINKNTIPCRTRNGRRSSYRCVTIMVTFEKKDEEEVNYVDLYRDYRGIERLDQCFYHPHCIESIEALDRETRNIYNYYKAGKKFMCFYNRETDRQAVVEKVLNTTLLHMMLWPSAGFLFSTTMIIVAIFPLHGGPIISLCCRNMCKKQRHYPPPPKRAPATLPLDRRQETGSQNSINGNVGNII